MVQRVSRRRAAPTTFSRLPLLSLLALLCAVVLFGCIGGAKAQSQEEVRLVRPGPGGFR
jgi:hypothetical protein